MKKALRILTIFLVFSTMILSACQSGVSEGPEDTADDPVEESVGKVDEPEDTSDTLENATKTELNLRADVDSLTMDPHIAGLTIDQRILNQIYESFLHFDEKTSQLSTLLADEYSISEDGLKYTFILRDDVYFHNGDKLKASDAVWSFKRAMEAPQMAAYVDPIADVEALDDLTVQFTLKDSFAPFIYYTTMVKIMSENAVKEAGELFGAIPSDSGTGPYRLVEYNPSTKIVLEAFSDYYRGEAQIQKVNFFVILDESTALVAFENGEIDHIQVPDANWEEIQATGDYTTETAETGHMTYLALNVAQDGPLSNKLVRQAIQYAIDKESLIQIVYNGLGDVAHHELRPGLYAGAQETEFVYTYDPEKARELLAEAGYPDGVDIGQLQAGGATYQMVAEVLQAQLAEVGITTEVLKGEIATMVVDWRAGNYDSLTCAFTPYFTYDYRRKRNDSRIETVFMKYDRNDEVDHEYINNLFDKAASTVDESERNAIYLELEEYLMDVAAYVPLKYSTRPFAWNKDLNADTYLNYFYVYDWSWNS